MVDFGVFWSAIQAFALAAAAAIAWYQIGALRRDQKAWKSLEACEKYDFDLVLNGVLTKLRDARDAGDLAKNPRPLRMEVTVLLNYLDGIATGVAQHFYNEDVIRDHLEPIIRDHVDEFLEPGMALRIAIDPKDYSKVRLLLTRWDNEPPRHSF